MITAMPRIAIAIHDFPKSLATFRDLLGMPVVDLSERGEDQHRRLGVVLAQGLDQRQPVTQRQHAIDDQHVVATGARALEPGLAVVRELGLMTALLQRLGQECRGLAVVFDYENAHGRRFVQHGFAKQTAAGATGRRPLPT